MPWLRENARRFGALALVAMALQIFGAWGHFHAMDGSGARLSGAHVSINSFKAAVEKAALSTEADTLPATGDGDALCPLCLVGNLVASAVTSSPPLLVLPIAYVLLGPPHVAANLLETDFATSFWSRGPPRS